MTSVRDGIVSCQREKPRERESGVCCCCFSLIIRQVGESRYSPNWSLMNDGWTQVPDSHDRFTCGERERATDEGRLRVACKPNGYLITPFGNNKKPSVTACWWRWNLRVVLWPIKWSEFFFSYPPHHPLPLTSVFDNQHCPCSKRVALICFFVFFFIYLSIFACTFLSHFFSSFCFRCQSSLWPYIPLRYLPRRGHRSNKTKNHQRSNNINAVVVTRRRES